MTHINDERPRKTWKTIEHKIDDMAKVIWRTKKQSMMTKHEMNEPNDPFCGHLWFMA